MRSFSEILKKTRESKGLSQAALATKSGMKPSAISHFESGRRLPSLDNLKKIADALVVTMDYLTGRDSVAASAGPTAQKLLRDFEQMSAEDQDNLVKFSEILANKNRCK